MDSRIKMNRKLALTLLLAFLLVLKVAALQAQPEPAGTARIYGHAFYPVGSEWKPIKYAKVELYEDSIIDTKIGTTATDAEGYYEFIITFTGNKSIYAKICCESAAARVTGGILGSVYSYRTNIKACPMKDFCPCYFRQFSRANNIVFIAMCFKNSSNLQVVLSAQIRIDVTVPARVNDRGFSSCSNKIGIVRQSF
jgi:hypothetical protein